MHFHVSYEFANTEKSVVEARFQESGALPPAGVTLVSRWHDVAGRRGFAVVESADPMAVAAYLRGWTDLITFQITPVINDEQLSQILAG